MVLLQILAVILIIFDIFLTIKNVKLTEKIKQDKKEIVIGDYD